MGHQVTTIRDSLLTALGYRFKSVGRFGRQRFAFIRWAYRSLPYLYSGTNLAPSCRLVEWKFVLDNLPSRPLRVLDAGANRSLFVYELAARGYDTFAMDFSPYGERVPPEIKYVQCDLMELPFSDAQFDAVTNISVIEHVGLGGYGAPVCQDGDLRAMRELWRILKSGGRLYLTTLVAHQFTINANRDMCFYDESHLARLTADFRREREHYYVMKNRWRPASKAEAFSCSPDRWALVCMVLRKKGGNAEDRSA